MWWLIAFIAIWLAFGVLAAGHYFAYFQRNCPEARREDFARDQSAAIFWAVGGLSAFLAVLTMNGRAHGWLWPWGKRARREAGLA